MTLSALFLKMDNDFIFYKYYWSEEDAFNIGEVSKELINRNICGYKTERHFILSSFNDSDLKSYYKLAEKYLILN